ncbi:hypothetical protein RHMOL_Rhmol04G0267800 [Rhododendron molle]|uniref:Uncharacterized protein n=1 Tax=Rhododendron molle TaxID=49168 RepID=A0ACC0P6D8_RHOML|nr:hypothetical protein RHMOL_Rhmol04G0267800 [Rhododendron molle]
MVLLLHSPLSPPSGSSLLGLQTTLYPHTHYSYQVRTRTRSIRVSVARTPATKRKEEHVVIVGAGIAGLATAVSLHRLGVKSVLLEQGESLRTGGTSLTLFKNGWRVLDAIGVGNDLRTQFLEIQGHSWAAYKAVDGKLLECSMNGRLCRMMVKSQDGRELRSFRFKDEDESQEVRAVERRILLETLANQLPPDSISFGSKLGKIERSESGGTLLELADGSSISAKVIFHFAV